MLQDDPQVWLMKCPACGAASASRLPTGEALDQFYENYYESPLVRECDRKVTFDDAGRLAEHLARRVKKYGRYSSIRMLDFGGGDGTIAVLTARELVKHGVQQVDITIVDYNKELIKVDDEGISISHRESIDAAVRAFDLVIASAVLEHVPNPKEILLNLLPLVKDGGFFYARTPCIAPLAKIFGNLGFKWDSNFPAHIHDLGQDFWESFLSSEFCSGGFVLLESRPSLVQTTFRRYFIRTLAAYVLKAPWYVLGRHYSLVGGWEVFVQKESGGCCVSDAGQSILTQTLV